MRSRLKKLLAVLLTVTMVFTLLPAINLGTTKVADAAAGGTFTLVTDASTLAAGDTLMIVGVDDSVYAMSSTQGENNRGQVQLVSGSSAPSSISVSASGVAAFTLGGSTGAWTFYDSDISGYLYAASSSENYLKTQATNNANGQWAITIASNVATIVAQGTYTLNTMQYNSNSNLFACYSSASQGSIYLYKQSGSTPTATPASTTTYSVTNTLTNCTSDGASTVASGATYSANLTANTGYVLPTAITVTMGGTALTAGTGYTYDSTTGAISIPSVSGNIVITAATAVATYPITYTLTNCTSSNTAATITHGATYSTTLTAADGYVLPTAITVNMNGTTLTAGTDYTYDSTTGVLSITKTATDPITIIAEATLDTNRTYTATFYDYNGTTVLSTQTGITAGTFATAPTSPTRTGYTFRGWALTQDGAVVTVASTPIDANTAFYAVYLSNDITIERYVSSAARYGLTESYGYHITTTVQPSGTYVYRKVTSLTTGTPYLLAYNIGSSGTAYVMGNTKTGNYITRIDAGTLSNDGTDYLITSTSDLSAYTYSPYGTTLSGESTGYYCFENTGTGSELYLNLKASSYPSLTTAVCSFDVAMDTNGKTLLTCKTYSSGWTNSTYPYLDYSSSGWDSRGTISPTDSYLYFYEPVPTTQTSDYYVTLMRNDSSVSQTLTQLNNCSVGQSWQAVWQQSADLQNATIVSTTFESSNESVATVSQTGLITLVGGEGEVEFTITVGFLYAGKVYYVTDHEKLTISMTNEYTPVESPTDKDTFPEYPNPGSVSIDKSVIDSSQFTSTGVAQVELSVRGIPDADPADVVIIMDVSGSMSNAVSTTDSTVKLAAAKTSATEFVNGLSTHSYNRVAVVSFSTTATTVLGLTELTSTGKASVLSAIDGLAADSGTNYDAALKAAYTILSAAEADGHKQYVIFMTDGAPGHYNDVNLYSDTDYTGASGVKIDDYFRYTTSGQTNYLFAVSTSGTTFYYGSYNYKGTGVVQPSNYAGYSTFMNQYWYDFCMGNFLTSDWSIIKSGGTTGYSNGGSMDSAPSGLTTYVYNDNIYGAQLKGALSSSQLTTWSLSGQLSNCKLYTIGFGLANGSDIITLDTNYSSSVIGFTSTQCTNLLTQMADTADDGTTRLFYDADTPAALTAAYVSIAETINAAVSDATVSDYMGSQYDLQIGTFGSGTTPTLVIGTYALDDTTRVRTGDMTALETITFTTDTHGNLTAAYSSEIGSGATNIYNATDNTIVGKYVTYDRTIEKFTWTGIEIKDAAELVMRYYVYLTGTMARDDGTGTTIAAYRTQGTYPTNKSAKIVYTNFAGVTAAQTFPVPQLSWGQSRVNYQYYLVNTTGQPVNTEGTVVPFSERTIISSGYRTFALNNSYTIYGGEDVPDGYVLFSPATSYTVLAGTGSNTSSASITDAGYWSDPETEDTTSVVTTKLYQPLVTTAAGAISGITDYTNTGVAFAVRLSSSIALKFNALGAQAHVLYSDLAFTTALYTDGIRFGVQVNLSSLQDRLEVGDYFALGTMMSPGNRLTQTAAFSLSDGLNDLDLMQMSMDASTGVFSFTPTNCWSTSASAKTAKAAVAVTWVTNPNATNGFTYNSETGVTTYTALTASNMMQWTLEMENAATDSDLASLLATAGMTIFCVDKDGGAIQYCTYMMFSTDATTRIAQANREIAYRGVFVRLSDGAYTVNYTYQKINSAQRVFDYYYNSGSDGWSKYAPSMETQLAAALAQQGN